MSNHIASAVGRMLLLAVPFVVTNAAAQDVRPDTIVRLPELRARVAEPTAPRPVLQRELLPVTASVTAGRVAQTINILDVQDAVKYLPSLFVRKRNNGDTQSTLATRSWGVGSSARSLVVADGVPLTALIANNNTIGGPRWGLVSPEEIARVDVMQGPFSAAYAGNSMGAVVEITTRQPERFEGSISQVQAMQRFSLYGTSDTYVTSQTGLHAGGRAGRFSFWASGTYANSEAQPLAYVTAAGNPANVSGGFPEVNRLGQPANVLGATGLLETEMINARARVAVDLGGGAQLAYSAGLWLNDAATGVQTYADSAGRPTFARLGGFAQGFYRLDQTHQSHSVAFRTDRGRAWDLEVVGSLYRFSTDRQRFPGAATGTDTTFSTAGRLADLSGTGWVNLDVRGAWHPAGRGGAHVLSAGLHADRYVLRNPTFALPHWRTGDSLSASGLVTRGEGRTRTLAAWVQDRWRLASDWSLTVGGRLERWTAFDGVNTNGGTTVQQPRIDATRFSPKAVLRWEPASAWLVSASVAKAYRFATTAELYQLVSTGPTFTSPDANLRPDDVLAAELRGEWRADRGRVQLSLFRDDVRDAITSQFLPLVPGSTTLFSYLANVDRIRLQGIEAAAEVQDVGTRGLSLAGSMTFLDARTLEISGRASATAPAGSAIGKQVPNVPRWRWTTLATYRPGARVGVALGARYSSRLFATLDNSDTVPNVFQGFASWLVADAKVMATVRQGVEASLGVDNIGNRKYFLFHPFPQRTFVGSLRWTI